MLDSNMVGKRNISHVGHYMGSISSFSVMLFKRFTKKYLFKKTVYREAGCLANENRFKVVVKSLRTITGMPSVIASYTVQYVCFLIMNPTTLFDSATVLSSHEYCHQHA